MRNSSLTIVRKGTRLLVAIALAASVASAAGAGSVEQALRLSEGGDFAAAETMLRGLISDPDGLITDGPARELEILRRTRIEYSLSEARVLRLLRRSVPGVTRGDVERWTESGALQSRLIDGERRYFRKAPRNVFLLSDEARERRAAAGRSGRPDEFDMTAFVRELVPLAEETDERYLYPVRHRVTYRLTVKPAPQRRPAGAVVRAWLPFPQEYGPQRNVRLLGSTPPDGYVSPNGSPHRTIYLERVIENAAEPVRFEAEYEFVMSASCADIAADALEPYDTTSELFRRYTRERLPHIAFTTEAREIARTAVGDATNPLEKARRLFHWVSDNIPWVGEREYGTIRSLSEKGLAERCGDCGVQGTVFITLCRLAGVPARWQSGWQTQPGEHNLHDWSEIYLEPWGWLPVDASYGVRRDDDPRVRDFFLGRMDPYRMIVNLDYARPLDPPKTSFRSEPNDFQRGEVEVDGRNLYFNEWTYACDLVTTPLPEPVGSR